MNTYPDHRTLHRLPWSFPDNPIAWLESTAVCNLYCEGCYRENQKDSHKSMKEIGHELDVFAKHRNFDGVSIAGGDPLTHPDVVEICTEVTRRGWKPIVNTNGLALTDELLVALEKAGVVGFTFHIDSKQRRPGWEGKNELELNELRLDLAERVARVGDISVAFNSTVYEDTLPYVPEMVAWAHEHVDKVSVMVFILYRQSACARHDELDFYVGEKKIDMNELVYSRPTNGANLDISSRDVVAEIRKRFPEFAPSAYLNGSESAETLKWLLTTQVISGDSEVLGYAGPRFSELAQGLHHLRTGRWLAYTPPSMLAKGHRITAAAATVDPGMRKAFSNWFSRPWRGGSRSISSR